MNAVKLNNYVNVAKKVPDVYTEPVVDNQMQNIDDYDDYSNQNVLVESAQKVDLCTDKNVKNRLKQSALYDMFDDVDNVFVAATESEVNKIDDDWCVNLSVKGKQLCVEIDTGAKCNILSLSALEALNVPYKLSDKTVGLLITGVHGESERSIGSVTLPCACNNTQRWDRELNIAI